MTDTCKFLTTAELEISLSYSNQLNEHTSSVLNIWIHLTLFNILTEHKSSVLSDMLKKEESIYVAK